MAADSTYEYIMTATVGGTATTLSNIPQTYTDLVLIINYSFGGSYGGYNAGLYVNGGNANHSTTVIGGAGSGSVNSWNQVNNTLWLTTFPCGSPTTPGSGMIMAHFNNYSNSTYNKFVLINHSVPMSVAPGQQQNIGIYQSSNPITSITVIGNSGSQLAEGTMTLWGIKAA
jgi:hypothetical protein